MSPDYRYFIKLSYNGKGYHGWQWQKNAITVQQVLEEALIVIFAGKIAVTGAGRTDTGVHAREFYAHFDHEKLFEDAELEEKIFKLNGFLPGDIFISDILRVKDDAHARFSALSRTYEYIISKRKDPFNKALAWLVYGDLDIEEMNKGAAILLEYKDFTSFSKLHTQVNTNNCNVMEAAWEHRGHLLVFNIKADRFLRNMVRAIVGTLVDIGKKKTNIEDLRNIIEAKDRSEAGLSVPAHGLFLANIEYDNSIWIK